ncbi:mitochondrial protoporphyrinogen oxidase [Scheffersomyces xylosifermentans]|uniref:mitochondrial protoporphyrinogen oxidase n=1 Tax=Scheffersomyces xylosifermentans TaxID=1304137 RepID=UPI00315CB6DB
MSLARVPKNGKVAVLGGGISGLSFAYFLSKLRPDVKIDLYEKSGRVGGAINSQTLHSQDSDILLEKGPRTLRGVSNGTLLIVDILKALKKENVIQVIPKNSPANKKYLLNQSNELVQVPDGIRTFSSFLSKSGIFTPELVFGILREPFRKGVKDGRDESIEEFFTRRFGNTVLTDKVLSAIMHGIYAGDTAKLSVNTILPGLKDTETKSGSVIRGMFSKLWTSKKKKTESKGAGSAENKSEFPESLVQYEQIISPSANLSALSEQLKQFPMIKLQGGLQQLPQTIFEELKKSPNFNVNFDSHITEVDPIVGKVTSSAHGKQSVLEYDHINSTIDSKALASVLPEGSTALNEFKSALSTLEFASIFLVNAYSKSGCLIPKGKQGFGFLSPKFTKKIDSNPNALLGIIFDSDVEKHAKYLISNSGEAPDSGYSKITLMIGGHYYNQFQIPSNSRNLKIVKKILAEILQLKVDNYNLIIRDEALISDKTLPSLGPNDILISYNLYEDCIPQYNVGYGLNKKRVCDSLKELDCKMSIGGTSFGSGIGVPDCVVNGLENALNVK